LEVLAQAARAPIVELARELGCSKLEAFSEKRKAAEALAPYLHPKLSSVAIYPPGHPLSGVPSTLMIAGQGDFRDITDAAMVEDTDGVDLPETRRSTRSTLSVAEPEAAGEPQSPAASSEPNQVPDATIALHPVRADDCAGWLSSGRARGGTEARRQTRIVTA